MEPEEIKKQILRKMRKLGYWGGRHTSIKNLRKGFPKEIYEHIEKAIKDLAKEDFFIIHKKSPDIHLALNPRKKKEIEGCTGSFETI